MRGIVERAVKKSVFRNLLLAMLCFGGAVGLLFPVYARVVLDAPNALSFLFFAMCVGAGLLVGAVNYGLFTLVVSRAVRRLVAAMNEVNLHMSSADCNGLDCAQGMQLPDDSADALGAMARGFNTMIDAIAQRMGRDRSVQVLLERLASSVELDLVAREVLGALSEVCEAPIGLLYVFEGDRLLLRASRGQDSADELGGELDTSLGCVRMALERGGPHCIDPERDGLDWVRASGPLGVLRPRGLVLLPLRVNRHTVGLALLASARQGERPQAEMLLQALCDQAAPHLQNAALHRRIKQLAALDELTGLLNRRFGLQRLREEFSRAVRHGIPTSVILFDVDHFKRVNDTHGHDAGDHVLRMIARTITEDLRAGDVLCRYGGEEFLVLAPGTGLRDAVTLGERIRRQVEGLRISWKDQELRVTVSLGLAAWPLVGASQAEELVSMADRALYQAKAAGRNRLVGIRGEALVEAAALLSEVPESA